MRKRQAYSMTGRVGVFDMGRNVTLKLTVPIL